MEFDRKWDLAKTFINYYGYTPDIIKCWGKLFPEMIVKEEISPSAKKGWNIVGDLFILADEVLEE